ncbi:hypothetical protein [Novosphingobium fuchskuhlense]|uniref:hypothetical protein n=1 Tax=Novosphingobium fuchskuhlense TaxID=1117702 RepID=UPI000A7289CE|nr:hypothetical protein [Novosphingobium fuchskuhlense]
MKTCRFVITLLLGAAVSAAAPSLMAQTVVAPSNVTAGDVVTAPLSELNIKKKNIPPILVSAREDPYSLTGLRSCPAMQAEIGRLDAALGDDIDVAVEKTRDEKRGNTVGSVARSVISSFIPFGGVIREVSGAAASERLWQVALYAGAVRRAFIKGYGQARGCRYPARSATAAQVAAIRASTATGIETPQAEPGAPKRMRSSRKVYRRHHR